MYLPSFTHNTEDSSSISYLAALQLASCLCSLQTLPAARSWYQRTKQLYCNNEHIQLEPTVANPAQARL